MKIKMKLVCTIALIFFSGLAKAQYDYLFYPEKGISGWDVLKKDSFGVYVAVPTDADKIVYWSTSKKVYKLLDSKYSLLDQGSFDIISKDKYTRSGIWTAYYDNGKIKATGRYFKDKTIGVWKSYYKTGQLRTQYSFSLVEVNKVPHFDMISSTQEFYENGQLKVDGIFKIVLDTSISDAVAVEDPKTGKIIVNEAKGQQPHALPAGVWYFYNEKGELLKTEEY